MERIREEAYWNAHIDDTHDYAISVASSPETWRVSRNSDGAAAPEEPGRHTGACEDVLDGFCPAPAQAPGHDQGPQDSSN
eukprot:3883075-Lingulodinium_polyedra.AAC.1